MADIYAVLLSLRKKGGNNKKKQTNEMEQNIFDKDYHCHFINQMIIEKLIINIKPENQWTTNTSILSKAIGGKTKGLPAYLRTITPAQYIADIINDLEILNMVKLSCPPEKKGKKYYRNIKAKCPSLIARNHQQKKKIINYFDKYGRDKLLKWGQTFGQTEVLTLQGWFNSI